MTDPATRPGRPTTSSVTTFVLSLCTAVATTTTAVLWSPIDTAFHTRADDAGWDTSLLLPDQNLLTLACYAAAALSLAMTVVALRAVFASRRTPDRLRMVAATDDGPRVWTA